MLRNMADLGLTMEQNVALSPVVHRLAVEDVKLNLADFFDNRYDEAQFGEMLSLVDAYLSQAPAERYGEHSKLNDMLEAKSSFDRSMELSDFFSQHDFSDEQRAAITAMFVGDVTRGQIDSIDESFTAEDIQAYDEILHNALQEFRGGRRKELLNMSGSSFGTLFQVTTWGESHGPGVGVVIDGCPAGISLTEKDIQTFLDRRKPGQSKYTTKRNESDTVEILSGVFEGRTTGTPISLMVRNQDQRSRDYGDIAVSYLSLIHI